MIASSAVRSVGGCSRAAAAAAVLLQQERQTIPGALSSTTSTNGIREVGALKGFSIAMVCRGVADLSLAARTLAPISLTASHVCLPPMFVTERSLIAVKKGYGTQLQRLCSRSRRWS